MRLCLHHLIEEAAARDGAAPALVYRTGTLSYAELWRQARGFGAALGALGLERGERVAIYLEKRIETVVAIFGASVAGAVFVPVNPLLRPAQVGHILADCDVRVLVTSPDRLAQLREALGDCPALDHVILVDEEAGDGSAARHVPYALHGWGEFDALGDAAFQAPARIDLDMAAILYTSGSTGKPKGVVLSHRNLLVGAESVSHYLGNTKDDVILSVLPLSFDAGLSQLTTGFSAGALVVLANYLLPGDVVKLCARHGVTGLTCVPPLWAQLAAQRWPEEASGRLRYFANTGGRMPRALLARLRGHFPKARPFLMYGLTEAFRSTYLDPAEIDRRPDSIGKAIPNAEILVLRPDGSPCEAGEEGELVHRGALVALGYWNDPVRTDERFRPLGAQPSGLHAERAVFSGDVVRADADGFLYFVGRRDEMIKTSGYRVSPTEIEEVAYATGLVREAAAFGVEDEERGQRVVLVASATDAGPLDEAALLVAMRPHLPHYMLPSRVIARDGLPISPNGKFDRARLRMELAP
nr:acyl-CoA ligase (AMP-forming), exosortase A system-associated [Aureimonas sp. AU40]